MSTTRYNGSTVRDVFSRLADSMSSFDELAVAAPSSLIDLKSVYPISRQRDIVDVASGGDAVQQDGQFVLTTSSDPNSSSTLTSVERARYLAGMDGVPGMGVRIGKMPTGNQVIEWGNTDFTNGYAVGVDAQGMFTTLYSGGQVVERRRRDEWDHPREDYLDPRDVHVYRMPFRWYGTGPYRLMVDYVGDDGRATFVSLDTTRYSPAQGPITLDPNQPLTVRVQNNGTADTAEVRVMGRQYFANGDYNPNRRVIGDWRLQQAVGQEWTPLIAFRQKAGAYDSISVKLAGASLIAAGAPCLWQIRTFAEGLDGTWSNPDYTDGGGETALEFNTTATVLNNAGIQVWPGDLIPDGSGNRSGLSSADLPRLDMPSRGDPIVLAARAIGGTATVSSVFRAREEW